MRLRKEKFHKNSLYKKVRHEIFIILGVKWIEFNPISTYTEVYTDGNFQVHSLDCQVNNADQQEYGRQWKFSYWSTLLTKPKLLNQPPLRLSGSQDVFCVTVLTHLGKKINLGNNRTRGT